MANRMDNLPKSFRIGACARCGGDFQQSGPNHKRCNSCQAAHKLEYERVQRRSKIPRPQACQHCSGPLPPDVHAHTKYCASCAPKARAEGATKRYASAPEKHREYGRRHYSKAKDRILADRKTEAGRRKVADTIRRKRHSDPGFRLHCNISRVISIGLNGQKAGRKWQSLVGYTLDDLRCHLERQFVKGMTWRNYGEWHVDHIRPRSSFQFTSADDAEFKACWALTNLQPLWAPDNLSKRDKVLLLL